MNLAAFILMFNLSMQSIPEIKMGDSTVLKAAEIFIDSVRHRNRARSTQFHLSMRIDSSGAKKIIYFSSVETMAVFTFGLPQNFFRFRKHLIFVHERKDTLVNIDKLLDFRRQFRAFLFDNLNPEGSIKDGFTTVDIASFDNIRIRFIVQNSRIESVRVVYGFPNAFFYRQGKRFDENGDIMFNDGSYDATSLDTTNMADSYEMLSNFMQSNFPSPRVQDISITLTIGPEGSVSKVFVNDTKSTLTMEQKNEYRKTFMELPKMKIRTIRGTPVSYRISLGL